MAKILTPGTKAPEFELHVTPDQTLSLSELQGRPVIIAFYPADWSPVCSDQMALYNEILPEFRKYKAELLGISVDGDWCHAAFAEKRHLHFPLLSDFEPKGAVAKQYGAYRDKAGVCERALFVLDLIIVGNFMKKNIVSLLLSCLSIHTVELSCQEERLHIYLCSRLTEAAKQWNDIISEELVL